ncbi:MAG: HdeD family acid-resistance protein [Butyricimonas paravirosa]
MVISYPGYRDYSFLVSASSGIRWHLIPGLAMYFSIVIIVIGISEIMNAFAGGNSRHWGWGLFIGLLDLIIGFILLIHHRSSEDILPYIVGFILMFKSIDYIAESLQMSSLKIRGWGWIFIAGIITLFFPSHRLLSPVRNFNIIIWTGLSFIFRRHLFICIRICGERLTNYPPLTPPYTGEEHDLNVSDVLINSPPVRRAGGGDDNHFCI